MTPIIRFAGVLVIAVLASFAAVAAQQRGSNNSASQGSFRIVIIEGEDAVNIIQQKSAVAPVVEVRDRNDQPVAGVAVRFAIRNGRATFSGARTLSVTTNAAGRAAAAGLTPTGSGAVRITASAAFQGQTAVATIAQTNVMTLAEAAGAAGTAGGAGGGSGTGAGAGAGAGGTGGGLSVTTIGIVGGAVAGGAIVAQRVIGNPVSYQGPFNMSTTLTRVFRLRPLPTCFLTQTLTGTVTVEAEDQNGTLRGDIVVEWREAQRVQSGSQCGENSGSFKEDTGFESPASNIQVSWSTGPRQVSAGGGGTVTRDFVFSGSLNGDAIAGTIGIGFSDDLADGIETHPLTTASVILQRQ